MSTNVDIWRSGVGKVSTRTMNKIAVHIKVQPGGKLLTPSLMVVEADTGDAAYEAIFVALLAYCRVNVVDR